MDAVALRKLQEPLKSSYRENPEAAVITLRAEGELDSDKIACKLETGRALAVAGLHPKGGGSGAELCSGDMLLEALVACAGVTMKAVATGARYLIAQREGEGRGRSRFPRHARRRQGCRRSASRRSGCRSISTPTRRRTRSTRC